jgi:hypothetical protein
MVNTCGTYSSKLELVELSPALSRLAMPHAATFNFILIVFALLGILVRENAVRAEQFLKGMVTFLKDMLELLLVMMGDLASLGLTSLSLLKIMLNCFGSCQAGAQPWRWTHDRPVHTNDLEPWTRNPDPVFIQA